MWPHSLRHAWRGHTRRTWPHLTAAPTLRAAPSDPLRVPKTAAQTRVCGVGQRAQSQPSGRSTGLCWLSRQAAARHCVRPAQLRVERADGGRIALEGRGGEGVELIDRDAQRVPHHRLREERGSAQRDPMHRAAPSGATRCGIAQEGGRQPTVQSMRFGTKGQPKRRLIKRPARENSGGPLCVAPGTDALS